MFPLPPSKRRWVPWLLGLGLVVCAVFACITGPAAVRVLAVPSALIGSTAEAIGFPAASEVERLVIREIRLPRLLLGLLTGAVLATAGAALQGLFRNPLADPGLIGVSAGGAVGAGTVIALGGALTLGGLPAFTGVYLTMTGAALGAIGSTVLIYLLSRTAHGPSVPAMLLCGIAVNTFAGALIGVFIFLSGLEQIRDLAFWTLGSLSRAPAQSVLLAAPILLGAVALLCSQGKALNAILLGEDIQTLLSDLENNVIAAVLLVMLTTLLALGLRASLLVAVALLCSQGKALNAILLGEEAAQSIGVCPLRLKRIVFLGSGVGVGAAVALTGTIGFVGLVVPHICRLLIGTDHRWLLPCSALAGGLLLAGTDLLARTVLGAAELPTGILTALLGAPFFLALLVYERKRLHLPL